jgi:hypothetical protein
VSDLVGKAVTQCLDAFDLPFSFTMIGFSASDHRW